MSSLLQQLLLFIVGVLVFCSVFVFYKFWWWLLVVAVVCFYFGGGYWQWVFIAFVLWWLLAMDLVCFHEFCLGRWL
jgi:hypothetical protein